MNDNNNNTPVEESVDSLNTNPTQYNEVFVKDDDYDLRCRLIQVASTNQATMYYDLRIESRIEDSVNKFYKSSDVVVIADNEEVIDILGYDFK